LEKGECGERCLGDGLRVAGSYFADEVLVGRVNAVDGYAVEEFVGAEGGAFVGLVEVGIGEDAGFVGGYEGDGGVVDEEGGWGVGGGAGVAYIAAEGGAVLVGDGAGPGGGLDEEGKFAGDGWVAADLGEGGVGTDGDGGSGDLDEAEFGEVVDGEERLLVEASGG